MALNSLYCADVLLRNYSLTHSLNSEKYQLQLNIKQITFCNCLLSSLTELYEYFNDLRNMWMRF